MVDSYLYTKHRAIYFASKGLSYSAISRALASEGLSYSAKSVSLLILMVVLETLEQAEQAKLHNK
jgi:hypothetical protein